MYRQIQSSAQPLAAVAINAGVGLQGPFWETDLAAQLNRVKLNVVSAVHLAHRVLKDMVARHEVRLLFTSSIAATTPGPFESSYNASKAFAATPGSAGGTPRRQAYAGVSGEAVVRRTHWGYSAAARRGRSPLLFCSCRHWPPRWLT